MSKYTEALESYMIPAEEGIGTDILKSLGKAIAATIGVIIGLIAIPIGICSILLIANHFKEKKVQERLSNPTAGEKESRRNYLSTWYPEIIKMSNMIQKDIETVNKKNNISDFLFYKKPISNPQPKDGYGSFLCGLDFSTVQADGADGDDEGDPKLIEEFKSKLKDLKPYFDKWKSEATKFKPYFELIIVVETRDNTNTVDYYYPELSIYLSCKYVDRFGIIKEGLPPFKG